MSAPGFVPQGDKASIADSLRGIRCDDRCSPCLRCAFLIAVTCQFPAIVNSGANLNLSVLCQPHDAILASLPPLQQTGIFLGEDICDVCDGYLSDETLLKEYNVELFRLIPHMVQYDNYSRFKLSLVGMKSIFMGKIEQVLTKPQQDEFYGHVRVLFRGLCSGFMGRRPEGFLQVYDPSALFTVTVSLGDSAAPSRKRRRRNDGSVVGGLHSGSRVLVEVANDVMFLAGNYVKLVRGIPQTRFLGERAHEFETSVEELISTPLKDTFLFARSKFASAGREDVDVRMLGSGRPFVVQMFDCRRTLMPSHWILQDEVGEPTKVCSLEEYVNASSGGMVMVGKLSFSRDRDLLRRVTACIAKRKTYRCVVRCLLPPGVDALSDEVIRRITSATNITVTQDTPVRVMHRRALLPRERLIHWMKVEKINGTYFVLDLETEGGTYIKEFVTSDFGRCSPSLAEVMGLPDVSLDILQLDVMNIRQ